MNPPPLLSLRAASLGYPASLGRPRHQVLHEVSLDFPPGQLTAILGPNGVGKSTLLRTLAGLQPVLHGHLLLCGESLATTRPDLRARRLAVVLTDRTAPPAMTASALVALGRHPHTGWLGHLTAHDHQRIQWALAATDCADLADRPVARLSDGERQRVHLARALAQDASLLLLDEPTAFLDPPHRVALFELLLRLAHHCRLAVILTTHDLDLAFRRADRIALLDPSGTCLTGAPEDLALLGSLSHAFGPVAGEFDPFTASFLPSRPSPRTLRLTGDPKALPWAERVALRAGWSPSPDPSPLLLQASLSPHRTLHWTLSTSDAPPLSGQSAAHLHQALTQLPPQP